MEDDVVDTAPEEVWLCLHLCFAVFWLTCILYSVGYRSMLYTLCPTSLVMQWTVVGLAFFNDLTVWNSLPDCFCFAVWCACLAAQLACFGKNWQPL